MIYFGYIFLVLQATVDHIVVNQVEIQVQVFYFTPHFTAVEYMFLRFIKRQTCPSPRVALKDDFWLSLTFTVRDLSLKRV